MERLAPKGASDPHGKLSIRVAGLAVLTTTYWLVGQRIGRTNKKGPVKGQALLERLALDLTAWLGRGFSERNIEQMRLFYLGLPSPQTMSAKFPVRNLRQ